MNDPKLHAGNWSTWGKKFKLKDIIGVAADLQMGKLLFSHNGSWDSPMGVAFEGLDVGVPLFPAISGRRNPTQTVSVNFGDRPMKYGPPDESYQTPWEVTTSSEEGKQLEMIAYIFSSTYRHIISPPKL